MVGNITTGSSVPGMVFYNTNREKKRLGDGTAAEFIGASSIENASSPRAVITAIETRNELAKYKYPEKNMHISLNFHADDILTNDKMNLIAFDYMREMGYGDSPYAVYRHYDKNHPHIHIVSSQIDPFGKKIKDWGIYKKSMKICKGLEKKYGITVAEEKQTLVSEKIEKQIELYKSGKGSFRDVVMSLSKEALRDKPTNEQEFIRSLEKHNISLLEIIAKGNKGYSYGFLKEEDSERPGQMIAGSDLNIDLSYPQMQLIFKRNKREKEQGKPQVKAKVHEVLKKNREKILLSEYRTLLQKKGIALEVKRRQTGDSIGLINGYIYKDLKTSHRYTGSELGLRLSKHEERLIDDKSEEVEKAISKLKDIGSPGPMLTIAPKGTSRSVPGYIKDMKRLIDLLDGQQVAQQLDEHMADKKKKRKKRGKGL